MSNEMLRIIDSIARERNVDKESLVKDIEQAMVSAARKHFAALDTDEFSCEIDRFNGEIRIFRGQELIPLASLGRIPAQTAKQVMIQKFREDERASIYDEFAQRIGEVVTGVAQRYEGGSLVVQLGRAEGFMPRSEQIPGEQHIPGERVRCMILDVRDTGSQVKIVLTRANPDFIKRLFELEVPEVSERIIEVKALAREPGHRTKVAVSSIDSKVDAVGACVGVRGSRIKNIVDELAGEKIDIVRWNESSQVLIANALRPAEVVEISLCFELNRATVVVNEDQLSLAIGKRGQNVRLAARLTGWDVDILTPGEFAKGLDILEETLKTVEGFTEQMIDRLGALGIISVFDIEEVGPDVLVEHLKEFELQRPSATKAVEICSEKAKEVAVQQQRDREEAERRKQMEMAGEAVEMDAAEAQAAAILGGPAPGSVPKPGQSESSSAAPGSSGGGPGSGGILDMLINRTASSEEPAPQAGDDRPHDVALADEQAHAGESDTDGAPSDPHPVDGDPTGDPYDNDVARLARGETADGDESDERSPS
ncbi:MAG: transcription termination factor NusA [Phycisphaeraceae bacterium]